jgi:hypothetical protein
MNNPEITRIVGKRTTPELCRHASGEAMKKAAAFNESLQATFPYGKMLCYHKGVYRFKTHDEANRHQDECIANTMAKISELNRIKNNE